MPRLLVGAVWMLGSRPSMTEGGGWTEPFAALSLISETRFAN
ncbi:UNVERIFIED_ORG: hypothetical protein GGE63_000620 [Rhizobium esperanzae]